MLARIRNLLPTVVAVVAVVAITGPYVVEARRDPARYGLVPPATFVPSTTAPRPSPTTRPPTTTEGASTSATVPPTTIRPASGRTGTSGAQVPVPTPTVPPVPTVTSVTAPTVTLPRVTLPPTTVTLPPVPTLPPRNKAHGVATSGRAVCYRIVDGGTKIQQPCNQGNQP